MKKKLFNKMSNEQLESKAEFINNYIGASNASEGSIVDSNANVTSKNIATLMAELHKDENIQIKRYLISNKIKELFDEETAIQYNKDVEDHRIYIHDETFLGPYCVSITIYPFLLHGLRGLGGESKAPKHLASFCGNFINLCYALASQFSGALAVVEFLLCFDYFARKEFGENYMDEITTMDKLFPWRAKRKKAIRRKLSNYFQQVIYSINQPASSRNYQSVFFNISIFDKYYMEHLFSDFVFPDMSKPNFESLKKLQKYFMEWQNKERTRALLTFPVVTATFLTDGNKNMDREFTEMCAELFSKGSSFFNYQSDSVDSLASCCRLRNEMTEKPQFSYSLGAGGVATGSVQVITINANRLVQDAVKQKKDIKEHLRQQVKQVHKYLYATKQFQMDLMKAGMLDAYTQGFIDMDKQFVTVGINGLLESAEFLGLKPGNNDEYKAYTSGMLKVISDANAESRKEYKMKINTELVPAENTAVKNYNWDKKDGYVVPTTRNCYNSYLYKVEDNDINIVDKFYLHGKDNLQYLDGGSALHLNLGEYATKESYIKLYDLAARIGCSYWTQNVRVTCCKNPDCGYIDKRTLTACPKCGSKNIAYATRIIGYLKMEPNFSEARQEEANHRWYHGVDNPNNVNNLEKGE